VSALLGTAHCFGYDVYPLIPALPSVTYEGLSLTYDPNPGDADSAWFDVNGSASAPYFVLANNGEDCALFLNLDGHSNPGQVWDGTDPGQLVQALQRYGFVIDEGALAGGATSVSVTSGTVSLGTTDAANVQGVYQVSLWIFGAILMLPIVLKVRPY
jgi:hypothetical protein